MEFNTLSEEQKTTLEVVDSNNLSCILYLDKNNKCHRISCL